MEVQKLSDFELIDKIKLAYYEDRAIMELLKRFQKLSPDCIKLEQRIEELNKANLNKPIDSKWWNGNR